MSDGEDYDTVTGALVGVPKDWWHDHSRVEKLQAYYAIIVGIIWIGIGIAAIAPLVGNITEHNVTPIGRMLLRFVVIAILAVTTTLWEFPAHYIAARTGTTVHIQDALAAAKRDVSMLYRNCLRYWPAVIGALAFTIILGVCSQFLIFYESGATLSDGQLHDLVVYLSVLVLILAMTQLALAAYVLNPGRTAIDLWHNREALIDTEEA